MLGAVPCCSLFFFSIILFSAFRYTESFSFHTTLIIQHLYFILYSYTNSPVMIILCVLPLPHICYTIAGPISIQLKIFLDCLAKNITFCCCRSLSKHGLFLCSYVEFLRLCKKCLKLHQY